MLAAGQQALAKSLFLGGVTRRFPSLNFAFLEGGVAWAAALLADIVGHWEKRNPAALRLSLIHICRTSPTTMPGNSAPS